MQCGWAPINDQSRKMKKKYWCVSQCPSSGTQDSWSTMTSLKRHRYGREFCIFHSDGTGGLDTVECKLVVPPFAKNSTCDSLCRFAKRSVLYCAVHLDSFIFFQNWLLSYRTRQDVVTALCFWSAPYHSAETRSIWIQPWNSKKCIEFKGHVKCQNDV